MLLLETHEVVLEQADARAHHFELAVEILVGLGRFEFLQAVDMLNVYLDQGVYQSHRLSGLRPVHDDLYDVGVFWVFDEDRPRQLAGVDGLHAGFYFRLLEVLGRLDQPQERRQGVGLQLDDGLVAAGDQELLLLALAQHRGKDPPVVVADREGHHQRDHGGGGENAGDEEFTTAKAHQDDRQVDGQTGPTLIFLAAPTSLHHNLRDHGFAPVRGSRVATALVVRWLVTHAIAGPEVVAVTLAHAAPPDR